MDFKITATVAAFGVGALALAAPLAANAADFEAKFGHGFTQDSPHHQAALQFKEEVERGTDGRVAVTLFHSGQVGSAREMFEALQIGSLEMTMVPTARISGFAPDLQIFDLPFLFPGRNKLIEVLDGPVGDSMLESLGTQGVKGLGFYVEGFKQITANRILRTPDDFSGVKMRTMESEIIMAQYRAVGADPVPVDFAEVYSALQMGTVDGQENPVNLIHDMKFHEVQDYLMVTDHAVLAGVVLVGLDWYQGLPEDIRAVIDEAARGLVENQREGVKAIEDRKLALIAESGTEIIELSDEDRASLRTAMLQTHERYAEKHGRQVLDAIYKALD